MRLWEGFQRRVSTCQAQKARPFKSKGAFYYAPNAP